MDDKLNKATIELIKFLTKYAKLLNPATSILMNAQVRQRYDKLIQNVKDALNTNKNELELIRSAIEHGIDHGPFKPEEIDQLSKILETIAKKLRE